MCRAFLRCVEVTFSESEIVAPASEPADVLFREAMFQVRELMKQGRRRGDEWKHRLIHAARARSIDDVTIPWRRPTSMSLSDLTVSITQALEGKSRKYGTRLCAKIDALVYVNLTETRFLRPDTAAGDISRLEMQGWRSVSVVFPPYGFVLFATRNAPGFLRQLVGAVHNQWSDLDVLFDA